MFPLPLPPPPPQVMAEKPASWKKLSAISQVSANPGTMAVKMQRSYHRMDEDETEVDPDDISKGLVDSLHCSLMVTSLMITFPQ